MVAAITLIGVIAMICFIICRRVYISYVILNFGCCPLNGLGKFRQNCPGYCQSLSAEMQYMQDGQGNYKKSHYNQPGRCNIAGVVLEENCCTEATEECGDSQTKEASLWQNLKEYFGFEHSASHDCSKDDITSMKIVNAPEGFNNAEENATLAEKTSNDVSVSGNAGYPERFDQVMEEVKDPMSTSVVALKERCHSESDMEVNNMDDSLTLTKESSNNVQVSGYPKDINQRNQVTKKIKDPMNAVSLTKDVAWSRNWCFLMKTQNLCMTIWYPFATDLRMSMLLLPSKKTLLSKNFNLQNPLAASKSQKLCHLSNQTLYH